LQTLPRNLARPEGLDHGKARLEAEAVWLKLCGRERFKRSENWRARRDLIPTVTVLGVVLAA
jgi:hypothetical protein